jgi:rfaE bifunctional protein nucleotidyltransferase chain/domain
MKTHFLKVDEKEKQITQNHKSIAYELHQRKDFKDVVCKKPWGYEFLVYESAKIGIWYLRLEKGGSTSLHTHFHKDTFMIVLSGCAKLTLINNEVISLSSMESVYIPKEKFHAISTFSDETYILEMEIFDKTATFSDKNDLLRIDDQYNRKKTGYESSIELIRDNLSDYNYFYFVRGFLKELFGITFSVWDLNSETISKIASTQYSILLSGEVYMKGNVLKEGSILSANDYEEISNEATVLSLEKIDWQEDSKIIYSLDQLKLKVAELKAKEQKIILSSGCFDILHVGHLDILKKAKALGDKLIICLSNDEQIRKLKGEGRPVNNYEDRINLFKVIPYVDYIVLYDEKGIETEETLGSIMKCVDPYMWVKGTDYTVEKILDKHPYLKKVTLIPLVENKSTTNIINKIKT